MRRNIIFALLTMFTLLLVGCDEEGGYLIRNGSITFGENNISGKYDYFNGYKTVTLKLKEGKIVINELNIQSESGELTIEIRDNDKVLQTFTSDSDVKEVNIPSDGKYKLKVIGDSHKGSFYIDYEIEESE